jgi:hypothetical protein
MAAGEVFFGVDRELFENTAFIGQVKDSSINEGAVRESINNILFSGSEKIRAILEKNQEEIASATLADAVNYQEENGKAWNLNGESVSLSVKRLS